VKIPIGDFDVQSPQTTFVTGVQYHFVVTNQGKHYHDFLIMHPMTTETMVMDDVYQHALAYIYNIAPGETKTLDFTFDHTAPAGMLEFSCHYGGHYEAGMHQPIVVNAAQGANVTPYPNNGIPTNLTTGSSATGKCDAPVTVTIGSDNTFKQSSVSLKMGDTLTVVNGTQQTFTLTTKPDAGIRLTIVDPGETEYVPFQKAGTFTLSSQEHPNAQITVAVASTPSVTCGFEPVATVSFDANYTNPSNQYFFVPTSVTVKAGQSITLSNLADYDLTFSSQPDAGVGDILLHRNEHQQIFFKQGGTYTISCKQFPNQHFTVTVQGSAGDN
jgi:plastocyanin